MVPGTGDGDRAKYKDAWFAHRLGVESALAASHRVPICCVRVVNVSPIISLVLAMSAVALPLLLLLGATLLLPS